MTTLPPPQPATTAPGPKVPTTAFQRPERQSNAIEALALALILVGGLVLPVLGWLAGVGLLWASHRWTTRQKLLGTLILPGGLGPAFLLSLLTTAVFLDPCITSDCGAKLTIEALALLTALCISIVAPIGTAVHLARRLRVAT
jgi:hypothetical protein